MGWSVTRQRLPGQPRYLHLGITPSLWLARLLLAYEAQSLGQFRRAWPPLAGSQVPARTRHLTLPGDRPAGAGQREVAEAALGYR